MAATRQFVPRPLMVEGHVIDDDGKLWTMRLREGLLWHDGTKVLARDCVASLQRWMKRDATTPIIMDRVEAFEATDDRTLVWRLRGRSLCWRTSCRRCSRSR